MKLGRIAAIALGICIYSGTTNAAALPGLPPAGSKIDVLDRNIYSCEQHNGNLQCRRSGGAADYVDGETALEIVLIYRQGVLVRSVVTFEEQRFHAVADKLSETLGSAARGGEALNAGMGGTFENQYYVWRHDGRVWLLEQFFQRIMHCGLWIMSGAEFDNLMSERERLRVRGVRNL